MYACCSHGVITSRRGALHGQRLWCGDVAGVRMYGVAWNAGRCGMHVGACCVFIHLGAFTLAVCGS